MALPESLYADTILVNGNVITVDDARPTAEAVAVKGDRILYVGSNDEVRECAGRNTRVIDCGGKTVLPGFIEPHTHFMSFGIRLGNIAERCGARVYEVDSPWGQPVDPQALEDELSKHPRVKAVGVVHAETSTGVLTPLPDVLDVIRRHGAISIVDAVTSLGGHDMRVDEWGIDALVTGSQKALMLPPGLAFTGLSDRAWERARETASPRFYFDLESERKGQAKGSTAYTPAVSLVFGLCAALKLMREEGLDLVYARHDRMARATRAAATAMRLKLLSPDNPSPAATGLYVPEGCNADALLDYLRVQMGVTLAEGQDDLQGKAIRIAHVGHMGAFDVIVAVSALEMAFRKFGLPITLGTGVAAAQEILLEALD